MEKEQKNREVDVLIAPPQGETEFERSQRLTREEISQEEISNKERKHYHFSITVTRDGKYQDYINFSTYPGDGRSTAPGTESGTRRVDSAPYGAPKFFAMGTMDESFYTKLALQKLVEGIYRKEIDPKKIIDLIESNSLSIGHDKEDPEENE